jgi:hypothetical protein
MPKFSGISTTRFGAAIGRQIDPITLEKFLVIALFR